LPRALGLVDLPSRTACLTFRTASASPNMNNIKSPRHDDVRRFLRIGGPLVLALGGVLAIVGFASFFISMAKQSGPPALFFCAFIGLPLMFVGSVMCIFGFVGGFSRYVAAEQAPVARDTINYMGDGTEGAVKTVARAAAQGITEGIQQAHPRDDSESKKRA